MIIKFIDIFLRRALFKLNVWQCLSGITKSYRFLEFSWIFYFTSCVYNWKGGAIYMTSPNLIEPLLLSRQNWSLHESAISFSLRADKCMTSFGYHFPVVYRTSKFSSTRHRKSQPFRET